MFKRPALGLVFMLQVLVLVLCSGLAHGATMDACMMVLLREEFHTTCSMLGRNHTRPCLVQSDQDVEALKRAKVIRSRLSVPRNKICATRTEMGEADCISMYLKYDPQQNWQWTEWAGTSPNIARRFTITEGNTNRLCPYEERYFIQDVFIDCLDALKNQMLTSGIYTISPDGITMMDVLCEQQLHGGGWTVFQVRKDGSVDFYQDWNTYKTGFGELTGEFWLGNANIHLLTKHDDQRLKVELVNAAGLVKYAEYAHFSIDDETQKYRLEVTGFSGGSPPGDSLETHNGCQFSTKDEDNDKSAAFCAVSHNGGYWYNTCTNSNLNGGYGLSGNEGFYWYTWGQKVSLKAGRMMIRKKVLN